MQGREEIIASLKKYFQITEFVCPDVFQKFGERAWQFFDTEFLYCILLLRETVLCAPMYINNYKKGYTQKGLRCNRCQIVRGKAAVYLSGHVLAKAVDFTVAGMTAAQARQKIKENADLFPCRIRLEKDVSWVHFDTIQQYGVNDKVYEFSA